MDFFFFSKGLFSERSSSLYEWQYLWSYYESEYVVIRRKACVDNSHTPTGELSPLSQPQVPAKSKKTILGVGAVRGETTFPADKTKKKKRKKADARYV